MSRQKTDIEVERAKMLKAIRAAVRLKHSLAADEELNAVLSAAELRFDEAVKRGELPDGLTVAAVLGIAGE